MKVMENSGQTDAERRSLRQSLRNLNKDIQNKADELEDANSEAFTNMRSKSNALWNQVKYTREAVLDGDNLEFLATRAARQVDKLVEVSTLYMHVLVVDDAVDTVDVAPADVIADNNTDHNTHIQISNHTNTHTHTHTHTHKHNTKRSLATMRFAFQTSSSKSYLPTASLTGRSLEPKLVFVSMLFLQMSPFLPVLSTLTILPSHAKNRNVKRDQVKATMKKK